MRQSQHYLTLDALRGIAALAVMVYHQQHARLMGHGYLAVDFFFILSGFVIARAYERKLLSTMSFGQFALVRIARLYPLLIAATLTSAVYMIMTSIRSHGSLDWLMSLPPALLAIPDPSQSAAPDPFPILPVVWSLFFELLGNFLYAAGVAWLTTRRLVALIGCNAAVLLIAVVIHGNGELGNSYATLWAGVPRVLLSFLAGVLLYRLHTQDRLFSIPIPPVFLAAILLAILAAPHDTPWFYDAVCIFVLFPLILIFAMSNEPAGRLASAARVSADMSYPLYLFHLPLMLWASFVLTHLRVTSSAQHLAELVAIPVIAYGAHRLFDQPIQSVLKQRLAIRQGRAARTGEARAL